MKKYRLKPTCGSHFRVEGKELVEYKAGAVLEMTDDELKGIADKFELVKEEPREEQGETQKKGPAAPDLSGEEKETTDADTRAESEERGPENEGKKEKAPPKEEPATEQTQHEPGPETPMTSINITRLSTREAGPVIKNCQDLVILEIWLEQEKNGEGRSTITGALESRINALKPAEEGD